MDEKSSKSAGSKAMSAALSANDRARIMCIAIGGRRNWNDTKESWRASLTRKIQSTERRVRSILSPSEKIRLSADEYLAIERAYAAATTSLASFSGLESQADAAAHPRVDREGGSLEGAGSTAPQGELDPATRTALR